jgi:hypothetical protein
MGIPGACRKVDHGSAIRILRCVAGRPWPQPMKKSQASLPDSIRQAIFLRETMDTRLKPAYDGHG